LHYLKDEAVSEIPVWRMIALQADEIRLVAQRWAHELSAGKVLPGESTVGGGSLPGETLPTFLLAIQVRNPSRFLEKLRSLDTPVIARAQDDLVLVDPRTVLPEEENTLLAGLRAVL
jgi:L-seryl-tRNA(Ser) seleniumtransferase